MITFTPLHQVPIGVEGARLGGVSYMIAADPHRLQYFDLERVLVAAVQQWADQADEPDAPPIVQTVLTFVHAVGSNYVTTYYVPVSAVAVEPAITSPGCYEPTERPVVARKILGELHWVRQCNRVATEVVFP